MREKAYKVRSTLRYSDDGEAVGRQVKLLHGLDVDVYPIKIGPGEHHVSNKSGDMIITVLGSCVSACIRDSVAGIGGMNHYMLPTSADGMWDGGPPSRRFGSVAMECLITDIIAAGGQRDRLEAKLVGGARMFDFDVDVGERNCKFGLDWLKANGIPVVSTDLRGTLARSVHYMPVEGRLWVKSLTRADLDTQGSEDVLWTDTAPAQAGKRKGGEGK